MQLLLALSFGGVRRGSPVARDGEHGSENVPRRTIAAIFNIIIHGAVSHAVAKHASYTFQRSLKYPLRRRRHFDKR